MNYNVVVNPNEFIAVTHVSKDGKITTAKLFYSPVIDSGFNKIVKDWELNRDRKKTFQAVKDLRFAKIGKYKVDLWNRNLINSDLPELISTEIASFVINACTIGKNSISPEAFVKFLSRLEGNVSNKTINSLYSFIGHNDIEIDKEGFVICYKVVRNDWKDVYSNTIDNSVGKVVKMSRNKVDDNNERTCSHGLHAASLRYLIESGYGQGLQDWRLIKLRIDPKDFVSVPVDYDGSKARVCEYTVVEECDKSLLTKHYY